MTLNDKAQSLEEIAVHLKECFGLSVTEATPIDKGWLNVKWKMLTDKGPLFVKHYHPERYKLHTSSERRSAMEKTLQLQHGLSLAGISCPKVHLYKEKAIQETASGLFYAASEWVEGFTAKAGYLSSAQMFDLGVTTGRMHNWLHNNAPVSKCAWKPDKDAYMLDWQKNWVQAQNAEDTIVLEWLQRSKAIVRSLDFRLFDQCPTGWLHWDLWVDNILLHGQAVAGIVDFDRMAMAYPELDVARAILSGALRDGQMHKEAVRAFMEGYRGQSEGPQIILSRAMRMLYLIESVWWLRTEVRSESELKGLLARFVEEIHWIEDNWDTFSDQLDTV